MRLSLLLLSIVSSAGAHELGRQMSQGAENFLSTLDTEQRIQTNLPFESKERLSWKYTPGERKGLPLKAMSLPQKKAALSFIRIGLSNLGETKVDEIIQLESILKEIENGKGPVRDSELYYVTVFGKPANRGMWSWRLEGHHLEIQVTLLDSEIVGVTPHFMGASPSRTDRLKNANHPPLEVLGVEDKLGRILASSFDRYQSSLGVLTGKPPADILSGTSQQAQALTPSGISLAELNPEQQKVFWQIVEAFVLRFKHDLIEPTLKQLHGSPKDKLTFAWMGGLKEGEGHYYRIQGPDFLLELDNTQNNANHVHTVWRDLKNDFGRDALRRHLTTEHAVK